MSFQLELPDCYWAKRRASERNERIIHGAIELMRKKKKHDGYPLYAQVYAHIPFVFYFRCDDVSLTVVCARLCLCFACTLAHTHTSARRTRQCLNCGYVCTRNTRDETRMYKMKTNRRRAKKKFEITELKHSSAAFRLQIAATECSERNIVYWSGEKKTEQRMNSSDWITCSERS